MRESGLHARRPYVWSAPDSGMSIASYCVVNSPCTQANSNEAVETSPFYGRVSLHFFFRPKIDIVYIDVAGNASPTLVMTNEIDLGMAPLGSGEALRTG